MTDARRTAEDRLRLVAEQMRREAALWPKTERAQQTARLLTAYASYIDDVAIDLRAAPASQQAEDRLLDAAKHAVMEWRLHGALTDSCRVVERAIVEAEALRAAPASANEPEQTNRPTGSRLGNGNLSGDHANATALAEARSISLAAPTAEPIKLDDQFLGHLREAAYDWGIEDIDKPQRTARKAAIWFGRCIVTLIDEVKRLRSAPLDPQGTGEQPLKSHQEYP